MRLIVRLKYLAGIVVGAAIVLFVYFPIRLGWPYEPMEYIPAPFMIILVFVGAGVLTVRGLVWLEREYLEPRDKLRKSAGAKGDRVHGS